MSCGQRRIALGRKAERRAAGAGDAAAAVDERIEHEAEELAPHLEARPAAPPVAASPESCVSALPRLAPVSPKTVTKPGGSVPPLLKKLLSAIGDVLLVDVQAAVRQRAVGTEGLPSTAVRFKIASVPV